MASTGVFKTESRQWGSLQRTSPNTRTQETLTAVHAEYTLYIHDHHPAAYYAYKNSKSQYHNLADGKNPG